jgi:hypothetical protein
MSRFDELTERYMAAWNEPDDDIRHAAVAELWDPRGSHFSYTFSTTGHTAIQDRVDQAYLKWVKEGGYTFRSAKNVVGRRNTVKFNWHMVAGTGDVVSVGFDFIILDDDGRIRVDYQFTEPATPSTERNEFIDRYVAGWNESSEDRRRAAVTQSWAPAGTLDHERGTESGHAPIEALMAETQHNFAARGQVVERTGDADGHHDVMRFAWHAVPAGSGADAVASTGSGFLLLDDKGKIRNGYQFEEPSA